MPFNDEVDDIFIQLEYTMKYALNWKQPLLSMSKRFFIFITLIFAGFVALSTYKTQLDMTWSWALGSFTNI